MGPLSTQNQTTGQLSAYCVWKQWIWLVLPSVCCFNLARMWVNILIGTSRVCRNGGFARITQMPSNTHTWQKFSQLFTTNPANSATRSLPSLVSILKLFTNGCFLNMLIDTVSFCPSDIFSYGSQRKRKN